MSTNPTWSDVKAGGVVVDPEWARGKPIEQINEAARYTMEAAAGRDVPDDWEYRLGVTSVPPGRRTEPVHSYGHPRMAHWADPPPGRIARPVPMPEYRHRPDPHFPESRPVPMPEYDYRSPVDDRWGRATPVPMPEYRVPGYRVPGHWGQYEYDHRDHERPAGAAFEAWLHNMPEHYAPHTAQGDAVRKALEELKKAIYYYY